MSRGSGALEGHRRQATESLLGGLGMHWAQINEYYQRLALVSDSCNARPQHAFRGRDERFKTSRDKRQSWTHASLLGHQPAPCQEWGRKSGCSMLSGDRFSLLPSLGARQLFCAVMSVAYWGGVPQHWMGICHTCICHICTRWTRSLFVNLLATKS